MNKILMSINQQYVNKIFDGSKKYEYRTRIPTRKIDSIVIYCTHPIRKIVGEVLIEKIIQDTPENLWNHTKEYSGVDKDFFEKYFSGRKKAYAYKLGKLIKYDKQKDLKEYGIEKAPQSYMYLN